MQLHTIDELINTGECDWIDYKEKHHNNNADLIHDILCLANSDVKGNRYLVFGIDDNKNIVGLEKDTDRKSSADLINLLQSARFNHIPSLKLVSCQKNELTLDILVIQDKPEKPYFLLQQYTAGADKKIRAGSIYMRAGDTNTPKDRTADDIKVERMYRQRFGIDLSPFERFKIYLNDIKNWKDNHGEKDLHFFWYEPFPEFTIIKSDGEHERGFSESWVKVFPDQSATRDKYFLKYHSTVLSTIYLVWCDGARYLTVMPALWWNGEREENNRQSFYFIENSLEHLANKMIQQVYPIDSQHYLGDGFAVFPSKDEAKKSLSDDLKNGQSRHTYYRFDQKQNLYIQIKKGREWPLLSIRWTSDT